MVYYKFWGGKSFVETPLPLLTVMFLFTGVISILMGLIAELVVRPRITNRRGNLRIRFVVAATWSLAADVWNRRIRRHR